MSKKLKNIMEMKKEERETRLRDYLNDLGGSLFSTYTPSGKHLEDEIVARIINIERSNREEGLWKIAFISAIASVVSALVALAAVFYRIMN
jgi:hypothetical protein